MNRIAQLKKYFDFEKLEPKWDMIMDDMPYINYCRILANGEVWLSISSDLEVVDMYYLRDSIGVIEDYKGEEATIKAPWVNIIQALGACSSLRRSAIRMTKNDAKQEGYIRTYGGWAETLYDLLTHAERINDNDLLDLVRSRIEDAEGDGGKKFLSGLLQDSRIAECKLRELKGDE